MIFHFVRLSCPQAPHYKFSPNIENNRLNKMTLGPSGQFDEIYHGSRKHQVFSHNILIFTYIVGVHGVWSLQVHIFNLIAANIRHGGRSGAHKKGVQEGGETNGTGERASWSARHCCYETLWVSGLTVRPLGGKHRPIRSGVNYKSKDEESRRW